MSVLLSLAALAAFQPMANDVATRPCANSFEPTDNSGSEGKIIRIFASDKTPLVMVSLDGGPHFPFTFDTGSSGNLISLQLAEQLALPHNGPSPSVDGAGNPVPGFDTCLNAMSISAVPVADRRATAFLFDRVNEEGIISPMQFAGSILKFDGPNLGLEAFDRDQLPDSLGSARSWAGLVGDAHPVLDIVLSGVEIEARLDSGSDMPIILPIDLMYKLSLESDPVEVGYVQTAADETMPVFASRIKGESRIGCKKITGLDVLFVDQKTPLIGWPLMKSLTFYMDPEQRLSYFPEDCSADELDGTGD